MITLKPITPGKSVLDVAKFEQEIKAELKNQGQKVQKLYEQATSTWSHKPAFVVDVVEGGVTVSTTDEIFGYVNLGTKPHIIRPKNAKILAFNAGGFVPKSRPRSLSAGGGSKGGTPVFAHEVHHPGNKPRNFDATVARTIKNTFAADMQKAVDRAIK